METLAVALGLTFVGIGDVTFMVSRSDQRLSPPPDFYSSEQVTLHPPHNHLCQQIFRPRHDGPAAEEQAHEVEFQYVGFASEFGGVVDARPVLFEGFVAAHFFWCAGIDRYLEEGAASAAQGF